MQGYRRCSRERRVVARDGSKRTGIGSAVGTVAGEPAVAARSSCQVPGRADRGNPGRRPLAGVGRSARESDVGCGVRRNCFVRSTGGSNRRRSGAIVCEPKRWTRRRVILAEDRDPLDVVLRRTKALLQYFQQHGQLSPAELSEFERRWSELQCRRGIRLAGRRPPRAFHAGVRAASRYRPGESAARLRADRLHDGTARRPPHRRAGASRVSRTQQRRWAGPDPEFQDPGGMRPGLDGRPGHLRALAGQGTDREILRSGIELRRHGTPLRSDHRRGRLARLPLSPGHAAAGTADRRTGRRFRSASASVGQNRLHVDSARRRGPLRAHSAVVDLHAALHGAGRFGYRLPQFSRNQRVGADRHPRRKDRLHALGLRRSALGHGTSLLGVFSGRAGPQELARQLPLALVGHARGRPAGGLRQADAGLRSRLAAGRGNILPSGPRFAEIHGHCRGTP